MIDLPQLAKIGYGSFLTLLTLFPAVIKSYERLTYNQVKALVVDRDSKLRRKFRRVLRSLDNAAELCRLLRARRLSRGSIDFDLPEPEVILDTQGRPEEIIRRERHFAHFIIEEFMIAANEAVARFLTEKGYPLLYRVHEEPDEEQWASMGMELQALGIPKQRIFFFPKKDNWLEIMLNNFTNNSLASSSEYSV